MMRYFFEVSSVMQILLLVLSQLAVIVLAGCCILVYRRSFPDCRQRNASIAALLILLLSNIALYVLMQLDSRITAEGENPRFQLPCFVVLFAILFSLSYSIWTFLKETKNRRTINNASIKESFDNLPTGVCFFNEAGLPVLCNRAMHRFSFLVTGENVQFVTDLEECLAEDFVPMEEVRKEGKVFTLPDKTAWQLEKRSFSYENGSVYSQYIATDVTELNEKRVELAKENDRLRRVQSDLQRLSANVVTATREEEILNTKMRVHDEMGRCLVEARKYLREDTGESIPASVVQSWQRAVSMLKYNNDSGEEDMLDQIRKTCESVGIALVQRGQLPSREDAYLLICAVRECVTNAVRYAGAKELYVDFSECSATATVSVSNDGKQPGCDIVEGGGLSTLRRRVEREGGTMEVRSRPCFRLTVTVPKGKEGRL